MPKPADIREAAELIAHHLELDEPLSDVLDPDDPLGGLPHLLAREILALLRRDLGRLTQLLYRIDVAERAVDDAFAAPTLEDVAAALAELVLARELRTVELRRALEGDD